ncbi:MAG: peptidase MA family metallohydrolase [Armatimonadota bacterium]
MFALLMIICAAAAAPSSAAGLWLSKETSHFTVYYRPGQQALAERTAADAESALAKIAPKLWGYPKDRIPVYVYHNRREFIADTGIPGRELVVGVAYSAGELMRIDGSRYFAEISPVIAHELTHILLYKRIGSRISSVPVWLNEGLAVMLSGTAELPSALILQQAASTGSLLSMKSLQDSFPSGSLTDLAYAQSLSFVEYLSRQPGKPLHTLDAIAEGSSSEEAFRKIYGKSIEELEFAWRQSLAAKHGWDWLGLAGTIGVGVLMLFGLYLAYRGVLLRKRRIIEEWEEEETESQTAS